MEVERWRAVAAVAAEWIEGGEEPQDAFLRRALAGRPEMADDLWRVLRALDGAEEFASGLARRVAGVFGNKLDKVRLRPGDVLGAHEILRELGAGGMGTVYLARRADARHEEKVAIKVMSSAVDDPAARDRFLGERRLLAGLDHPAIVRLIDGGVTDAGRPYHVLEYVEGVTADRFADGADLAGVLRAFRELCDAVAHVHARRIIHGDLKPANVMVTDKGRVKLLDFGVARTLGRAGERPLSGDLPGPITRNYAAPELLVGVDVDTRADVYGLGVLLYRLTCGQEPYRLPPRGPAELRAAREALVIPPLVRRGLVAREPPPVIAALDAIVRRATAVVRDERTGSVRELGEEIERVQGRRRSPIRSRMRAYRLRKAISFSDR